MKDLLRLYSFESVHGSDDEKAIADWICKWLDEHNVTDYTRTGNNIYRFSNSASPILSAHLDQVETNGKAVRFFKNDKGIIGAYNSKWERTSLGADDKNGIWIILQALKVYPETLNFVISEGEEVGCVGINVLDAAGVLKENISPSQFCIVMDRKGAGDMLNGGSSDVYCSTLAQDLCNFLGDGFSVTTGTLSDTRVLCKYCESVNMSTAYYDAHSRNETTDFNRLEEIKKDVFKVLQGFIHYSTDPSVYVKKVYTPYRSYSNFNKKKDWEKDDYYDLYSEGGWYHG